MRKILSIIGAIGLTATAASTVVACAKKNTNNPTADSNDVEKWLKQSKDNKENSIIFIGGRHDSDSLSYIAARNYYLNDNSTTDVDELTSSSTLEKIDGDITKDQQAKQAWINGSYADNNDSHDEAGQGEQDETYSKYLGVQNGSVENYTHHSILVDDIKTFWSGDKGLGKDLLDGVIKQQVKDYSKWAWERTSASEKSDADQKEDRKQINKSFSAALKEAVGPFFIVVRNGTIVGIETGYKNYNAFAKGGVINEENTATKELYTFNKTNAIKDMDAFYKNINNNIFLQEVSYLEGVFSDVSDTPKYIQTKDKMKDINGFDKSNLNTDWPAKDSGNGNGDDKPEGSDGDDKPEGSDGDDKPEGSDDGSDTGTDDPTTDDQNKNYNININNYIN